MTAMNIGSAPRTSSTRPRTTRASRSTPSRYAPCPIGASPFFTVYLKKTNSHSYPSPLPHTHIHSHSHSHTTPASTRSTPLICRPSQKTWSPSSPPPQRAPSAAPSRRRGRGSVAPLVVEKTKIVCILRRSGRWRALQGRVSTLGFVFYVFVCLSGCFFLSTPVPLAFAIRAVASPYAFFSFSVIFSCLESGFGSKTDSIYPGQ